jgi:nucleotide-binding universal stress UspA family protein
MFWEVKMLNKILSPLDGSEVSKCSLDYVRAIAAGRQGVEVVLLNVIEFDIPFYDDGLSGNQAKVLMDQGQETEKRIRKESEEYLAKAANTLIRDGIAVKTAAIRAGPTGGVAGVILNYAENNNIELIIMSTHGRSGISRWAMGSVADRIVHSARVPVLTITPAGCRL